jgi:uncharacterized membrane protein
MAITGPITAGLFVYAIHRAAGDGKVSSSDIFSHFGLMMPLLGLVLLQYLLIVLGLVCVILPGIYLALAYSLAIPLRVEHQLGTWEALETSRKAISQCWFQVLGLFVLLGLAAGVGTIITLGIGLIWIVPWYFMVMGVLYNKIFGCMEIQN